MGKSGVPRKMKRDMLSKRKAWKKSEFNKNRDDTDWRSARRFVRRQVSGKIL